MRGVGPAGRWSQGDVTPAGLQAGGATVPASSSSGGDRPARLRGPNGRQSSGASGQFSAEDKEAASVLPPPSGSFRAAKSTETLGGPTTPTDGDENPDAIWAPTKTMEKQPSKRTE
jgi:hypothetical protein